MVERNRDLILIALAGIGIILFLQIMAYHGPEPEEVIKTIRCAEKARQLAEDGECLICLVDCDEANSPDMGQEGDK